MRDLWRSMWSDKESRRITVFFCLLAFVVLIFGTGPWIIIMIISYLLGVWTGEADRDG